jgi:hypothetical protein
MVQNPSFYTILTVDAAILWKSFSIQNIGGRHYKARGRLKDLTIFRGWLIYRTLVLFHLVDLALCYLMFCWRKFAGSPSLARLSKAYELDVTTWINFPQYQLRSCKPMRTVLRIYSTTQRKKEHSYNWRWLSLHDTRSTPATKNTTRIN